MLPLDAFARKRVQFLATFLYVVIDCIRSFAVDGNLIPLETVLAEGTGFRRRDNV